MPAGDAEHVRNWALLAVDEKVRIRREDGTELIGHVDAVTDDGEILWVQLVAGAGRKLFVFSDGGRVWRASGDPRGSAASVMLSPFLHSPSDA